MAWCCVGLSLASFCWALSVCLCRRDAVTSVTFQTPAVCADQVATRPQVGTSVSAISCAILCASATECQAMAFDPDTKSCQMFQQLVNYNCPGMDTAKKTTAVFIKTPRCVNGGTRRGDKCECPPGYTGQSCELGPMRDCHDYAENGQLQASGVLTVRPTSTVSFPVYCFTSGQLAFMLRTTNLVNFTRPWRDYRDGFGIFNDTHWLGLEKLHILTSQDRNYSLQILITFSNGTWARTVYDNFTVMDESHFFQFSFRKFVPVRNSTGDCLTDLRGANFSTYDRDNDGDDTVNCAGRHQGGWWFRGKTCSTCNPTGQLLQSASGLRTGVDSEVFWIKDLGDVAPFKIKMTIVNM